MFEDLLIGNRRFQATYRDLGTPARAARGLAVLTCIDSRIDPLHMLGLHPGDAKIVRNAGARVTQDALRSLVLAVNLLGVRRACIVQHTDCTMVGSTEAQMRERVAAAAGVEADDWDFLATIDQASTLREDIAKIRACPLLPRDLGVAGFVLDVNSGALNQAEDQ